MAEYKTFRLVMAPKRGQRSHFFRCTKLHSKQRITKVEKHHEGNNEPKGLARG